MARECALTRTRVRYGRNVSHSNRKTSRRFEPNLQKVTLQSESLGLRVPLRITTRALRTVQKKGGLDAFLVSARDELLTPEALRLKRRVKKALATPRKKAAAPAAS